MKRSAWTHKVVKMSRGMQGEWFAHRTAATFPDAASAIAYAAGFATKQREAGVSGTRIVVITRKGRKVIANHNINRGDLPESRRNADVVSP